ncbi:glycosyltransferase [Wenxinia marina]|uniref:Glycosyltransferase involved in cell wall biogenesis n=1 Tax=Wenxinia marina DSM 24838 TaxID=1123501 RepID=A0A0D0Q917_9RHOB|nr:glycosyltransferase [Wenxinia marina]KIQ70914.1 Glycosyltransferase involved in cell wall biogenesis [Wenxinia marina DSM 24838]GGL56330.1 hypothetical protein GCM10011392_08490 [Wenxinia marina]
MIAVIVPASNEADRIGACLSALARSEPLSDPVHVVVAANGCADDTVDRAEAGREAVEARGWRLTVLDLPQGGKPGALNAADAATDAGIRVYLDADVTVSPSLLPQLAAHLAGTGARYASGRVRITGQGPVARAYARTWGRVPFMSAGVPGCGLFAVNAAGRARWGAFPEIIADDAFVRLHFAPHERTLVAAHYDWPIAEGAGRLLRVRRRQDAGVREIAARWPELMENEDKGRLGARGALRLFGRDPLSFGVYAGIGLLARTLPAPATWSRGR